MTTPPASSSSWDPSPVVPGRHRASVSSRTSLNPTQGLIPISPTDFFQKRLTGWSAVIRNLIRFFELTIEQERRLADVKIRHSRDLAVTTPHLFEAEETFQVVSCWVFKFMLLIGQKIIRCSTRVSLTPK
jgi:hypothetical protein